MCNICRKIKCDPRCPNYEPLKAKHYCSFCDREICEDDKYIEKLDGDVIHYECVQGIRQLLSWLGQEIKTMERKDEFDERNY